MKLRVLLPLLFLSAAHCGWAAPPKKAVLIDHSNVTLIDGKMALDMLGKSIPARVWKIYPVNRWGFVSQVEGGFTPSGICVITARVMMMELTPTRKQMEFRPHQTATAFDALPGATREQCRNAARGKLQEAIDSVVSSLVKD